MNKKILIPLIVVLVLGGYAGYTFAMPHKTPKVKIAGTLYVMPKQFTLNMADGQYATLTVGLQLAPTQALAPADPSNTPPEGFGDLPEEAAVRAIITNDVTDQPARALISASGRAALQQQILKDLVAKTDDKITAVYFTDLAVQ